MTPRSIQTRRSSLMTNYDVTNTYASNEAMTEFGDNGDFDEFFQSTCISALEGQAEREAQREIAPTEIETPREIETARIQSTPDTPRIARNNDDARFNSYTQETQRRRTRFDESLNRSVHVHSMLQTLFL